MADDWYRETPEGVVLNVRAQPRSSRAGLDGFLGDALKVRIRSAPVDGKANRELIGTLADAFGIPKSSVAFRGGETSKTKRILLRGVSSRSLTAAFAGTPNSGESACRSCAGDGRVKDCGSTGTDTARR